MTDKHSIVLVVEDQDGIREALKLLLQDNFAVSLVASAEQALALPLNEAKAVGVLLLDGNLGTGTHGLGALAAMRAHFPGAAVIYTSALANLADPATLAAAGITEILPKPWRAGELLDAVRRQAGAPSKDENP